MFRQYRLSNAARGNVLPTAAFEILVYLGKALIISSLMMT
jgi:hypothetical protein